MDGKTYSYIDNDYVIQKILRENSVTEFDVFDWLQRNEPVRKEELGASLSVWWKSLDHHLPSLEVDAVFFAHPANFSIVEEIQKDFNKILFPLQTKTKIYSKESWKPITNADFQGSLHFETHDKKIVSTRLGFLVVTPEFCEEEWKFLAGQPFFQNALYKNQDTVIPILVDNPRKVKVNIPMGIKCLKSVDYYNRDHLCQNSIKNLLEPVIKNRKKEDKRKIKNLIYWLYEKVIKHLPPRVYGNKSWASEPKSEDSAYYSGNNGRSYERSLSGEDKSQPATRETSRHTAYRTSDNKWTASKNPSGPPGSLPRGGPTEYQRSTSLAADDQMKGRSNENTVKENDLNVHLMRAPSLDFSSFESSYSNSPKTPQRDRGSRLQSYEANASKSYGETPTIPNRSDVHRQSSSPNARITDSAKHAQIEDLTTKQVDKSRHSSLKPFLPDNLPVPREVACSSFGNISSLDSNTNSLGASEVRDLSSSREHSQSIDPALERNDFQRAFKQRPVAWPVSVTAPTFHSFNSIDSSGYSLHPQSHPRSDRPLPHPVGIDNLPSVNLTYSFTSRQSMKSEATNPSLVQTRSRIQPQPVPTEISLTKFPSASSWNDSHQSHASSITSVPGVTRLHSGEFPDQSSFSSTSFTGKQVGVVKPFSSSFNDDDEDSDNDSSFVNDLSFPPEETHIKTV